MPREIAIGIDLGTTNSCVAVVHNGGVEVIKNEQGSRTTPSCVAFTKTRKLVGEAAVEQNSDNPENTVRGVKRMIGRNFKDDEVQSEMKHWPFKVVENNKLPMVEVSYLGETKRFTPEQISSMVLTRMKEIAETFLNRRVNDAVITIPAYFKDSQRQATKQAAQLAGLNVKQMINEPTAAAMAYGMSGISMTRECTVLVYDLGGGTFDVSIVTISGKKYDVKASTGNNHLGGEDFDNNLVEFFADDFMKKHKKDVRTNKPAVRRLRSACERAKRTLSSRSTATVEIRYAGIEYTSDITREEFDELCDEQFRSTINLVDEVLKEANLAKDQINDVVLVGGSTRIPKVQKLLANYFNGRPLKKTINPDEAVAYGAAVQAAILSGSAAQLVAGIQLKDIVVMSLGVETVGGVMSTVIPRNLHIPISRTKNYTTVHDNQSAVRFKVFQGEANMTSGNQYLGEFLLTDIQRAPKRVPSFEVTFTIDLDGILHVSAIDKFTQSKKSIKINELSGGLLPEEIDRMIHESDRDRGRTDAIKDLEDTAYDLKSDIDDMKESKKITAANAKIFTNMFVEVLELLAGSLDTSKEEILRKREELQATFDRVTAEPTGTKTPARRSSPTPTTASKTSAKRSATKTDTSTTSTTEEPDHEEDTNEQPAEYTGMMGLIWRVLGY